MEARSEWERLRAEVARSPRGADVVGRLRELASEVRGEPEREDRCWLVVYASSRMMDDQTFYVVPETCMDDALRADLITVDGQSLFDARGALAASALRLAVALGGASFYDAEVESLELEESHRPDPTRMAALVEVWWPHRLRRDEHGRLDATGLSRVITRIVLLDDVAR